VIEGVYMVANDSPVSGNDDIDREGVRVGVILGSAYDLFLSRELKHAVVVRASSFDAVLALWSKGELDCIAGVKPQLEGAARRMPGLRILPGRFMTINQAMGTPRGRDAGAKYLRDFVEEMKRSGFIARAFSRHRIEGASMAPAAAPA
jgi:polar amino acid transport system substrate-binding protein